jgi:WD40 repeat protein
LNYCGRVRTDSMVKTLSWQGVALCSGYVAGWRQQQLELIAHVNSAAQRSVKCLCPLVLASLLLLGCSETAEPPATADSATDAKQETTAAPGTQMPATQSSIASDSDSSSDSAMEGAAQQELPLTLPDYMQALPFDSAAVHPGALAVAAGSNIAAHIAIDGTVIVWDTQTLATLETIPPDAAQRQWPSALALSPDGSSLAIGRFDALVTVRSRLESKAVRELRGHVGAISALEFSPDGRLLASGGDDATTFVWELGTGRRLHAFDSKFEDSERGGIVVGLGFSGDSQALAVNEWYSRHYDVERGTSLWDLGEGIEIGTRRVAPPNNDNVMRSGQAVGANNWLLAYTGHDGLLLEQLDRCASSQRIAGPAVTEDEQKTGHFATTVVADPLGRWVAALSEQQLQFYATTDNAAPVLLELPIRAIALIPHADGNTLYALAVKATQRNGNEHFIFGRDVETVTAGALYAISIPESVQLLPPLATKPDVERCAPSATARAHWSYRLPDKAPTLPVLARLRAPGDVLRPEDNRSFDDIVKLVNPPSDAHFADDGLLYVLHDAPSSDAQSGVVAWDPLAQRVLHSHFKRDVYGTVNRVRNSWLAEEVAGRLLDLKTGQLLLDKREDSSYVTFTTDVDTGEIYRTVDGQLERYGAGAERLPLETRDAARIATAARNGKLALMYADGAGEVRNFRTGESRPFLIEQFAANDGCAINNSRLSADGRFLELTWDCVDSNTAYPIIDLHHDTAIVSGPVLGPFPKRSTRVVVPDVRANQLDIWDLAKGEMLARLPRHPSRDQNGHYQALHAVLSDDGRLVASGSYEGLVRVWDVDAKRVVGEAMTGSAVTALAFDSAGRSLAVSAAAGEVLVLDLSGKPVAPK